MKIYRVEVNGVKVDVKESLHVVGIDAFRRLIANLLNVPPAGLMVAIVEDGEMVELDKDYVKHLFNR